MITLPEPIVVPIPSIVTPEGEVIEIPSITLKNIDYSVTYDNTNKTAAANIKHLNQRLVLWKGDDYVNAGQFTDVDVDNRVKELLGSDPVTVLSNLFKPVTRQAN